MGKEERDAVESRKLKVENQPKRRRIQRRDAEHTEVTQRGGLQWAAAGIPRGSGQVVPQNQITYYHMITVPVK
jgi:hypothetical protein